MFVLRNRVYPIPELQAQRVRPNNSPSKIGSGSHSSARIFHSVLLFGVFRKTMRVAMVSRMMEPVMPAKMGAPMLKGEANRAKAGPRLRLRLSENPSRIPAGALSSLCNKKDNTFFHLNFTHTHARASFFLPFFSHAYREKGGGEGRIFRSLGNKNLELIFFQLPSG